MLIDIMQKRINEIKQQDRKAYYEIANEIGISEYSLYSFVTKNEYSQNTQTKIKKYLKDYKTKDEQIEQWKHEYEVLDACCELAQGKIAELKAENDRLIEGLGVANKYVNKYHQTLQEIKKIAERQLLVTNVRTYQMIYYADFSEYRNEILQKITAYLKGYLTKDEKLEAYRLDNEELKTENDRLKEANQSLSMLGTDLASANETVRKEFFRADKNKDMWREKAEKLHQTLQEIKGVVTALYMNNWLQMNETARKSIQLLQDLITKAEEE